MYLYTCPNVSLSLETIDIQQIGNAKKQNWQNMLF